MWTVDSPFHQNLAVYEKYKDSEGFASFAVSPSDIEAMKLFYPKIPYFYIPHGTDPEIWTPEGSGEEKEHDIVFLGSVRDYEQNLADLKGKVDQNIFKLLMNIYDYALKNPEKSFWEIYNMAADQYRFDRSNLQLYLFLFQNVCYNITDARRVRLIESLNGLGVKVWGNATWQKYIKGDAQYMGSAEIFEAANIVRKSKIVLHLQPMQIINGFHERIFNATASGSYLLCSHQSNFEESFGDNIGYYKLNNIAGVAEKAQYMLASDDEREGKASAAREITLQNHTWESRAKEILNLIKVEG
jgi:spore maturation protein CgeB